MMRTFDNDELRRRVDEVLFYVWDPIGISPEPCARCEYENYVSHIFEMLVADRDSKAIADCLAEITRTRMELPPDKNRCETTADLLIQHKRAIIQGLG